MKREEKGKDKKGMKEGSKDKKKEIREWKGCKRETIK